MQDVCESCHQVFWYPGAKQPGAFATSSRQEIVRQGGAAISVSNGVASRWTALRSSESIHAQRCALPDIGGEG